MNAKNLLTALMIVTTSLCIPCSTRADWVGKLSYQQAASGVSITATANWDNQTHNVFGMLINPSTGIGQSTYKATYDGSQIPGTLNGSVVSEAISGGNPVLSFTFGGFFDPSVDGTVIRSGNPFYSNTEVSALTTTLGFASNLKYVLDGLSQCLSDCPVPGNPVIKSDHVLNAFQPVSTPVGSNVTVITTANYFDVKTQSTRSFTVAITFDQVTTAGETVVSGSAVTGANYELGWIAAGSPMYLDIVTTALWTGNAMPCFYYVDANNDGIIDGTSFAAADSRLQHSENGIFVDRTVLPVDTANKRVCALVTSFSEFVHAVRAAPINQPLTGKRLRLIENLAKPAQENLNIASKDPSINLDDFDHSVYDPVVYGGSLHVTVPGGEGLDMFFDLPKENWRRIGKDGANKGYRYVDKLGPIRRVTTRNGKPAGRAITAVGHGDALNIDLTNNPIPLNVVLKTGQNTFCWNFGGTVEYDQNKLLRALDAPAPPTCPTP